MRLSQYRMRLLKRIDELIKELYWPSRSAFVREACFEKLRREQEMLRRLSEAEDRGEQSGR
ncbi:MAG: ribbon-helix-helix domain-containing protein [Candidatus Bathyarchaeia archaeon]